MASVKPHVYSGVLVVFTYAPAGLGHLRVTNALHEGLPSDVPSVLLGSHDTTIATIHRFTSIHPFTRQLMHLTQDGLPEDIFTTAYRLYLSQNTTQLYEQFTTVLEQTLHVPKTVLVIATHFGLAHQLSALKPRLRAEKKVNLLLVVQVTDDSPQHIWYVPDADLTLVPSHKTKNALEQYGRLSNLAPANIIVSPYPVSPHLARPLSEQDLKHRSKQYSPHETSAINVVVPVSGAAVGTEYICRYIDGLNRISSRYQFHVVTKSAPFTQKFIQQMAIRDYVHLYTAEHDREVVNLYEKVYMDNTIALEVTKPSEQSFKALITPNKIGGALLLFSRPIGRQEYDNVYFFRRHQLLPTDTDMTALWHLSQKSNWSKLDAHFLTKAGSWRALKLLDDPYLSAHFTHFALESRLFTAMFNHKSKTHHEEIADNGVMRFWELVDELIKKSVKIVPKNK